MRPLGQYGLLFAAAGVLLCAEPLARAQILSDNRAQDAGKAARMLAAANQCTDSGCTFAALSEAAQADPANAGVLIAFADYYSGRNQSLKARELLQRVIQQNPGNYLARTKLADLDLASGRKAEALGEYRRLEREFPATPWLQRELAIRYEKLGMADRALELGRLALARDGDDKAVRDLLLRLYAQRHDAKALRALYEQARERHPEDRELLIGLADLDMAAGRYEIAETELRQAMAMAPSDATIAARLADLLDERGDSPGAKAAVEDALRQSPADDSLRLRLGAQGLDPDAGYVVNAAELAKAAPQAGTSVLADVRIRRVAENGLSTLRWQQVIYIGSEQAAREYASRSIQYAPGSQQLHILAARSYKPDGRTVEAEQAGEANVADASEAMYYDGRSRELRFPSLEKGDVLELDYRITPTLMKNPYGTYFGDLVAFRSQLPEKLQRYVLATPADRHFNILEHGLATAVVNQTPTERTYRWEVRDSAALSEEPRSPALTEVAPYVNVSSFASWNELGKWYAELIGPQFTLDASLQAALNELLAHASTTAEKINAIHQFVLRNTHYVALEFGIYGYKPYPVSQTYARRFGDCKDKASLMIALLRAAGIPAEMALVRTRRLGDIGEQATSIAIFNHAIVYIPGEDLWLDGTAEYAGPRELPLDDQGAMALTVASDGAAQLRRVPQSQPLDNYTRRTVEARIAPSGAIWFSGSALTRGEDAPGLRREYAQPERQREAFRDHLAEILPAVHVDAVQVEGASDVEHDIAMQFRGELNSFTGRTSLTLPTTWMSRPYVETLAPLATRTEALLLPAPWTTEEQLRFALPRGARIDSLPSDTVLDSPFGSASFHYTPKGSELMISTSVQFRRVRIEPGEYAQFREFCSRIESAFREEVKVVLAP